ncbi:MAG TPA: sigma-70 family RNA polymerase sigma factor [Pirellulaceae bacterium]|nr:sigma-70 family RNA polymerase sigma factor [Pirellulaceae bacterium]HMO94402.1 sigma-70 family RNA polymerase sigma factor [Pirellulaceae bacterium]HMP71501.1 sigma-70 family RNA polymerase sigma factor [Pirellulaceae bacterium]
MTNANPDLDQLLQAVAQGDSQANEQLFALVYNQLHEIAERYMRRERADHTLQPTALIHEAWLKLITPSITQQYQDQAHFVATASLVMRRILVNHANAHKTQKRGGDAYRQPFLEIADDFEAAAFDLLALDEALENLAKLDPRQAKLVELRFFGGLSVSDAARALNISERTAHNEWAHARAWLRSQLEG